MDGLTLRSQTNEAQTPVRGSQCRGKQRRVIGLNAALLVALGSALGSPLFSPLGIIPECQAGLLLISVDGLRPHFYRNNPLGPRHTVSESQHLMPYLEKLSQRGASWDAVETIFPSLTYPAHTTLMTGALPSEHGVFSNRLFDLKSGPTENWYFFASQVKSPTLWSEAVAAGKSVAIVRWPATVGSNVTYLVPEIFGPEINPEVDWKELQAHIKPELFKELTAATGIQQLKNVEETDEFSTRAAAYLWGKYQPDFMATHLIQADLDQHFVGLDAAKTVTGLRHLDGQIERLLAKLDFKKDTLVIVGDHGFRDARNHFLINDWLEKNGYLAKEQRGSTSAIKSWKVASLAEGGMAYLYVNKNAKVSAPILKTLRQKLESLSPPPFEILSNQDRKKFGGDPGAELILVANPGWAIRGNFDAPKSSTSGPIQSAYVSAEPKGHHGYLPTDPQMQTGLIIVGPGVQPGQKIPKTSLVQLHRWMQGRLGIKPEAALPGM